MISSEAQHTLSSFLTYERDIATHELQANQIYVILRYTLLMREAGANLTLKLGV